MPPLLAIVSRDEEHLADAASFSTGVAQSYLRETSDHNKKRRGGDNVTHVTG